MRTKLVVVRHGETEWNVAGRLQGSRDSPLTPRGQEQSLALRSALAPMPISAVYASDLGRALETARLATEDRDLPIRTDARLREIAYGVLEGLTWEEIAQRHPDHHRALEARRIDYAPPGGESRAELVRRIHEAIEDVARAHATETVLVTTHGGALESFLRHVLRIPPEAPPTARARNCAINIFEHHEDRFHLVTWGATAHLEPREPDL